MIGANFIINAVQAQMMPPEGTAEFERFMILDIAFTCTFAAELLFNAFGHWFREFVNDGWSLFDSVVVSLSLVGLFFDEIPFVSVLRTLRVLRVLRLINRFQKIKRVIDAIAVSIIPVANAFFLGLLIVLIFAILGVSMWADRSYDHFGTLARACFTLFVLAALNDWEAANELPAFDERGKIDFGVVLYLFTFVVIVLWVIVNVIVAVLLDNFISATITERTRKALDRQKRARTVLHALDPVLEKLARTYDTSADLSKRIGQLFRVLDTDLSGKLNFSKLREGLRKLDLNPRVHLSKEDFENISEGFLSETEEIDPDEFDVMMRIQLAAYSQRTLADAIAVKRGSPESIALLSAVKILMMDHDALVETRLAAVHERSATESIPPGPICRQTRQQASPFTRMESLTSNKGGLASSFRKTKSGFTRVGTADSSNETAFVQEVQGKIRGIEHSLVSLQQQVHQVGTHLEQKMDKQFTVMMNKLSKGLEQQGSLVQDERARSGERRTDVSMDSAPVFDTDLLQANHQIEIVQNGANSAVQTSAQVDSTQGKPTEGLPQSIRGARANGSRSAVADAHPPSNASLSAVEASRHKVAAAPPEHSNGASQPESRRESHVISYSQRAHLDPMARGSQYEERGDAGEPMEEDLTWQRLSEVITSFADHDFENLPLHDLRDARPSSQEPRVGLTDALTPR